MERHLLCLFSLITLASCITEVKIIRTQFDDLIAALEEISVDITGETIQVHVDLTEIENLLNAQIEWQRSTTLYTLVNALNTNLISTQLTTMQQNQETNIAKLDELIAAIAANTGQLVVNDEHLTSAFEDWMRPIQETLTSIKAAVDLVKDAVDLVNSVVSIFQEAEEASDGTIESSITAIQTILETGAKQFIATSMEGMSLELPDMECVAFESPLCEGEFVVGASPLACEAVSYEVCTVPAVIAAP